VDNILQHEEYHDLGEFPGAHCLDISNPKIYEFLESYISEISKSFSTRYFHIGCDESFDIGRHRSKDFIKKNGKSKALVSFYEKIYQITKKYGNDHVIMYDDIVRKNEEILNNLNKDFILMYWDYSPKKKFSDLKMFLNAGYRVIASPSMLNWQRMFPDNKNARINIIYFAQAAYEHRNKGCLGILTSTWGDMRYYSFRENEIFGAILNGAVAWNTLNFEYSKFKSDYGFLFYGIERSSLDKFNKMFSLLSKSAKYYYRVSVLLPPLFFTYLFKHPFPAKRFKSPFESYKKLGELGERCLEIYHQIKSQILFEADNFEYLGFAAELAIVLKDKIDISQKVSDILNKSEVSQIDLDFAVSNINKIKDKIIYIKNNFERLWLRAAKSPCLGQILKLFDFLIHAYEKKIDQLSSNIFFKDPYLESEWIWTANKNNSANPRYFRKTINMKKPIKKAIVQAIACNHMKIYVNNHYVGQVLSRYSMSILPIVLRVRIFDITELLKEGENLIAIEAYYYDGYKGGINIFGQILLDDNTILEILSDKTWLCQNKAIGSTQEWLKLKYDDSNWDNAFSLGRPPNLNGDIFKPDLLNGEISDTQDYFGIIGYMSNFTEEYDQKKLKKMIRIFNPYGN
jgi:hypothetical protein